jgi:hypothetical protein
LRYLQPSQIVWRNVMFLMHFVWWWFFMLCCIKNCLKCVIAVWNFCIYCQHSAVCARRMASWDCVCACVNVQGERAGLVYVQYSLTSHSTCSLTDPSTGSRMVFHCPPLTQLLWHLCLVCIQLILFHLYTWLHCDICAFLWWCNFVFWLSVFIITSIAC